MSAKPSNDASHSAVARLLDRAPDHGELQSATLHVAAREQDLRSLTRTLFVFRLGSEWLGLPAAVADEVIEPRPIHGLPHRREGVVRGLVNVRGQLTVCVALEALLQLQPGAVAERPGARRNLLSKRLVVLSVHDQRLAFESDEVHGSHRYDPAAVGNVPATVALSGAPFSTGVLSMDGGRSVGLLDVELMIGAINRRLG
ncbi:chemotaxis protein CheW [Lysobacter sp. CA199]|uniref:chemotaxis protein CheW n=1 Tax=Lysobacter sp. CA199 TaxID=3455608 RepID=UPI003F8D058E